MGFLLPQVIFQQIMQFCSLKWNNIWTNIWIKCQLIYQISYQLDFMHVIDFIGIGQIIMLLHVLKNELTKYSSLSLII